MSAPKGSVSAPELSPKVPPFRYPIHDERILSGLASLINRAEPTSGLIPDAQYRKEALIHLKRGYGSIFALIRAKRILSVQEELIICDFSNVLEKLIAARTPDLLNEDRSGILAKKVSRSQLIAYDSPLDDETGFVRRELTLWLESPWGYEFHDQAPKGINYINYIIECFEMVIPKAIQWRDFDESSWALVDLMSRSRENNAKLGKALLLLVRRLSDHMAAVEGTCFICGEDLTATEEKEIDDLLELYR